MPDPAAVTRRIIHDLLAGSGVKGVEPRVETGGRRQRSEA
jgi:hypothetical protein